ncbi:hypothetical protein K438DRAFT_1779397 [Mycena galopus ATCC 62051]|nr:hypothetical protein K438DRAFT_1779397 [Mycena galopus ATCC 62051]
MQSHITRTRLNTVATGLTEAVSTLALISAHLKNPCVEAICPIVQSLLFTVQTVTQNRKECIRLLETIHQLLNALIYFPMESETLGELPSKTLKHMEQFAQTLRKIHDFVGRQQPRSLIKKVLYSREKKALLKDCHRGLEAALDFFKIDGVNIVVDASRMQQQAQRRHQEVLRFIESLLDKAGSDTTSSIRALSFHLDSTLSVNTKEMLPSEPKIFHGRESEVADILGQFLQGVMRIAILGAGGMGKTALARAVLHHPDIVLRYDQNRCFVACDTAATHGDDLAAIICTHLRLKSWNDPIRAVMGHFSSGSQFLLILDNLESLWEPLESRIQIEDLLSLLTNIKDLALIITMRGAERPAKVQWTHPFLRPLGSLTQEAARKTFMDITDKFRDSTDVDQVLCLTDNMPLAIDLIAHLVDSDGCATVLARWAKERTYLISEGFDKRSNLHLSISLSLSSPRMMSLPESQDLLSLLSILPDGLSDLELVQSNLPIAKILACKVALIRTSLAYIDDCKRIKVLVPIREYMQRFSFPPVHIVQSLLQYFQDLLETTTTHLGTVSAPLWLAWITSNHANIGYLLLRGFQQQDNPDLNKIIHSTLLFSLASVQLGRVNSGLIKKVASLVFEIQDHQAKIFCITHLIPLHQQALIPNLEGLLNAALSLAVSNGNTLEQARILNGVAGIQKFEGDYKAGLVNTSKAQALGKISGNFLVQARALMLQGEMWMSLGDHTRGVSSCHQAQDFLFLCGMSDTFWDLFIRGNLAEVHRLKSEYVEAQRIRTQILEIGKDRHPFEYAWTLMCLATIGVATGEPEHDLRMNISTAKSIFQDLGHSEMYCDIILADIELREGNLDIAMAYLQNCLYPLEGDSAEYTSWSLERLANGSCWNAADWVSRWATVFLAHSLKLKRRLNIHKALQYWIISFKSTGGVTRDRFYLFDISTAAEILRDTP